MKEQIVTWIDRILIADVFLVIFAFIWFALGVIGRSIGVPLGFDLWLKLWIPLFNPAIGILFLGTFASWGIKKISQKFSAD